MANVDEAKTKGKAAAKAEGGEFHEKPKAAPMVPAGGGGKASQAQIAKMADAGYEQVDQYAKQTGTQGEAPTVIDRDELDNLIGVPFVIVEKTVRQGDFGPYLSLVCILPTDDVVVVNAGGTALEGGGYSGIPGQLENIDITPERPHRVPNGLRRSDYTNRHTNTPSTTYYLDYADEKNSLFARLKSKTKKPRANQNGTAKA